MNTIVEYKTPHTPKQNGIVERGFSYLWDRIRAMLNHAGFHEEMWKKLWAEEASTAVNLDNLKVKNKTSSYEKFYHKSPTLPYSLRIFREMVILKKNDKIKDKLTNRGELGFLVGYPESIPTILIACLS